MPQPPEPEDLDNLDDLLGEPKPEKPWLFKKGRPPGPGAPLSPVAILTRKEVQRVGMFLLERDRAQIEDMVSSGKSSMLQTILATVCLRILDKGDMHAFDILLNRMIGKVRDEVHHSGDLQNPPQVIVNLPSNGREAK